jgi:hypothetical protein
MKLAVRLGRGAAQVVRQVGILEGIAHLLVEPFQIKPGDAVDQEGAHDRHQGKDQKQHDQNQLHMQTAKHGTPPFCAAGPERSGLTRKIIGRKELPYRFPEKR